MVLMAMMSMGLQFTVGFAGQEKNVETLGPEHPNTLTATDWD